MSGISGEAWTIRHTMGTRFSNLPIQHLLLPLPSPFLPSRITSLIGPIFYFRVVLPRSLALSVYTALFSLPNMEKKEIGLTENE